MHMISKWLESAYEHTSPLALCSGFASVLAPSVLLLYTGTYNIWFHLVFLSVAVGCFAGLLLHIAGLKARMARLERQAEHGFDGQTSHVHAPGSGRAWRGPHGMRGAI
jgi:hypothetical protein